jgi:capsular exopolysaccharide synthesis family protein
MPENANGLNEVDSNNRINKSWVTGPKEFIFKYLRYLPIVILSASLFVFLAYLKIRYTTPIFKVQSSLLITSDANANPSMSKDQRFQELFMASDALNLSNEVEVLRSRPVLQRVTRDLDLQTSYYGKGNVRSSLLYPLTPITLRMIQKQDPTAGFTCKVTLQEGDKFLFNENKTPVRFGDTIESGGDRFLFFRNKDANQYGNPGNVLEVTWLPVASMAEVLQASLKIAQPNDQSTILGLSYEGENSALGMNVINTLMAVYDTLVVEDKNRIAGNTLRFINDRLYELSDTIKGVQGVLTNFMVQNKVFDVENQSKNYLDKMGESARLKAEQEVKIRIVDFMLEYISNKKNTYELVPTNLGIEEPALLQLVSEYNRIQLERDKNVKTSTPTNPLIVSMDQTLDKIRRDIYQALLNVKQAYMIASSKLELVDQELQSHVSSLPGKSLGLLNIERRQRILEELYSLLLQKKLEISLSSASTISNSRVVEPATASNLPVSPDKKKIYMLYFFIGVLIPVGFVAAREMLQDKVTSKADVEKYTTAPILGEIGHSDSKQALVVKHNSRRLISEQFRIIRTNLKYLISKVEKPVIMVTSSFSGEGKSFVSTNMGAVMALSGRKTVIMEFDIRKPKIVSGLDLKRKMGITNYIIGRASFEELLVKVEGVDDLYVIPCGPIPPNPSELLLDRRLDELMQEVKDHFDVVIMDTAPIGLVSDAVNLGRFADCTMYITRQGYTFRKQLGLVEDLYINKKLPKLCLLLNDVKAEGGYYSGYYGGGYGYYGAYGYGKGSGYFEEDLNEHKRSLSGAIKKWLGIQPKKR